MSKRLLCILILCMPLLTMAQGIQWTTGLSWQQVKQKAKAESKYIFLDCFATWCAPCKLMDKTVYIADSVGEFINVKFIAVRVQMDKTGKDDDYVRQWYNDADSIKRQFHVESYPTFLFFNPDGQITGKKSGFKQVGEFIAIGKSAMIPGKLYDDPYANYDLNVAVYKQGVKDYDQYPSMIKIADKLGDTSLSRQLTKEFTDYVSNLPLKQKYTKERIEFWNDYTWLSNTRVFGFFYKDTRLINKVVNKKGYAERFVDKTIQYEIALPFMKEEAKGSGIAMEGAYLVGRDLKPDVSEADWDKLGRMISAKYGKAYAKRNVLIARVEWYKRHWNELCEITYSLLLFKNDPPDMAIDATVYLINEPAWRAFLNLNDKHILKGYIKWMKILVQHYPGDFAIIDTYANLLYKVGYKKEAIKWEEKAIKLAKFNKKSFEDTLDKMKKGLPTYIEQGAIWANSK